MRICRLCGRCCCRAPRECVWAPVGLGLRGRVIAQVVSQLQSNQFRQAPLALTLRRGRVGSRSVVPTSVRTLASVGGLRSIVLLLGKFRMHCNYCHGCTCRFADSTCMVNACTGWSNMRLAHVPPQPCVTSLLRLHFSHQLYILCLHVCAQFACTCEPTEPRPQPNASSFNCSTCSAARDHRAV